MSRRAAWLVGAAAALLFLRVLLFAGSHGAVEHDSGWYLGVAKNLAHRGIYASPTNTMTDEGVGPHESIHGRVSVQDEKGFSYFPAGVTVGPGYVVPQAFFLALFGDGPWTYRAWPLLSFALFLAALLLLAFRLGGVAAAGILAAWLWCVPQLYVPLAYEAFSEQTALLFVLAALLLVDKRPGAAGISFSLACLTKQLSLLAVTGPVVLLLHKPLPRWVRFAIALAVPLAAFELYRYVSLTSRFGVAGWEAINEDIRLVYKTGGSGLGAVSLAPGLIFQKLAVWQEVGVPSLLAWAGLAAAGYRFRDRSRQWLAVYASCAGSLGWFLLLSTTGWARHAWQGIVLGMVILSAELPRAIERIPAAYRKALVWALPTLLFWAWSTPKIEVRFPLPADVITKWREHFNDRGAQGLPPHPIFSLADQRELASWFPGRVKENDRVYYLDGFLIAEVSPLVDKVFYPVARLDKLAGKNPGGGRSILIYGPYQMGPWSLVDSGYVRETSQKLCRETLFSNASYVLCELRGPTL